MKKWPAVLSLGVAIVFSISGCSNRIVTVTPGRFALFPSSKAAELLDQCSRPAPAIEGTWEPTAADIAQLEADLPRLIGQKARGCCIQGWRLREVDSYFRQYVGVVVEQRKVIYINAFPYSEHDDSQLKPFKACDGGPGFWGAVYDPERRVFVDLAFNGMA